MAEGIVPFQSKQQLLEICKELEFVDDAQDLKCTWCNRLALEHWYTNCGHALCSNCKSLLSGGGFNCHQCGHFIQYIKEQSVDFEEKVNCLLAKCPNSRYGCRLVTTVKQMQEHLIGCEWTNTTQMLLKETSGLKEQISEMNIIIGSLLSELHRRQEVEDDFKMKIEMSVEDIKRHLNGLSSDLHFEVPVSTLKAQTKNINFEQLQNHFSSKEEVKQQEQQLTKLDVKTTLLFQMLDEKVEKFSQRLTKEIETIKVKNLEGIVKKFSEEFKMELHKFNSDLAFGFEQQGTSFDQKLLTEVKQLEEKISKKEQKSEKNRKKNKAKIKVMMRDIKKQEVKLIKQIHNKTREEVKGMEDKLVSANAYSNKIFIQMLDQKEDRFSQKLTKHIKAVEGKMKIKKEENNELKQLSSQLLDKTTQMSLDVQIETEKLKEEIDQLNKKIREMEKNIDDVSKLLSADVQTIQKLNPQLNLIEAFERGTAIEQLVNRKSSVQQLIDSFLFGSAEEQMVFESLCLKWTIIHLEQLIPTKVNYEHMSGIFPVYGYKLKAQIKLEIWLDGVIHPQLCFTDEEREGQEVDIKPLPVVTFIIKDLSGQNKNIIINCHQSFNKSLKYNEFVRGNDLFDMSKWNALIPPHKKSMEILVLVEPPIIINKSLSVNGAIMDTIQHYSRKLQMVDDRLNKDHWSPSFLTHAGGYRVAVGMQLNWPFSYIKRGLKATIQFLSGEFDSQLDDEFEYETSVTLINQLDAKKNITVKQQGKEPKYNFMEIASEDEIGSGGFLVNDSLTYHVTIKSLK